MPLNYFLLGTSYNNLNQYDNAVPEFEEALEIFKKWDSKPYGNYYYIQLGSAYHKTGQYQKEKQLYRKAEQDFPDDPSIIRRQAVLALTEGDTVEANRYIEKYKSINKANITRSLADIYSEAGIPDKAEQYYRQGLSLDPKSTWRMHILAYFLIDKDRNINEGIELVDKALESNSDNFNYLHTKGWGFFKQGKYQEALEILQKSWDLRREKAMTMRHSYISKQQKRLLQVRNRCHYHGFSQ